MKYRRPNIEVQVVLLQDTNGDLWKQVKLVRIEKDIDEYETRRTKYLEPGWLNVSTGQIFRGTPYSGGATGCGLSGGSAPTKEDPDQYDDWKEWCEVATSEDVAAFENKLTGK